MNRKADPRPLAVIICYPRERERETKTRRHLSAFAQCCCNDEKQPCNQPQAKRAAGDKEKASGALAEVSMKAEVHRVAGCVQTGSAHHHPGVAHGILQVGLVVPQVDGTGFQRRVQSHLQRADKITGTQGEKDAETKRQSYSDQISHPPSLEHAYNFLTLHRVG